MGKKASTLPTGQSQYQVVGRFVPNEKYKEDNAQCKVYRMNLFAKNKVVARSRFWYFMGRLCRVKKANGQIISVSQIFEKTPERVKNFGIWFRYDSRTGTHNAYKEFREMALTDAINSCYQDMAGRSRAKSGAIQILKTAELKPEECKRPTVKQFHTSSIKFPLPHRIAKTPKEFKSTFKASKPTTFC
jgi:large subunit ribosomal protein L18Ae